ncbi:ABC-type antimicrobial peptide transport system, permease component [Synechococcus sp. PCC 7502]|uniref:ABC transporter permease n=1 Tax=Synechococcus sp. PCC 7502 TaxID=1173263 RepID=UPI00029FA930|nr:ABC transporter permease [Synechococcus sp. PCC 7502]AFY72988.1 ABC-type antimicrobial peptide transport system, permease component [Synechococcus sp. PCC 7502]
MPKTTSVSLIEVLIMSFDSLWSNRLRTSLTMLGMIIGIAAVIAITSVGQGVQLATAQQIQALGSNVLLVLSGVSRSGGISLGGGSASTLTWEDAKAVRAQVPSAKGVTAFLQRGNIQMVYADQNTATTIIGTDIDYSDVKNIYPQSGQFFAQTDMDAASAVVVLGSKVRDDLFPSGESPLGQSIRIQNRRYRVLGVMESKGAVGTTDQDDRVYIPLTNMSSQVVGNNAISGVSISGFWVSASDSDELEAAQFQVSNLLRLRHNIIDPRFDDFRMINQVDTIAASNQVVGLFTVMVGAIAGISLVVGGIGIANIMLVSVVERTREIGVRKAVGATRGAILTQFLMEAIVVSAIGGCLGVIMGIGCAYAASGVFAFPFVVSLWSIFAGLGLSVAVGLVAGVIPARSAAGLDPITALRSD